MPVATQPSPSIQKALDEPRAERLFQALLQVEPMADLWDLQDKARALVMLADEYRVDTAEVEKNWVLFERGQRDLSLHAFERWCQKLSETRAALQLRLCPQCFEQSALLVADDRWLCPHCASEVL